MEKKADRRQSGSSQRNNEEKEGRRIKETPVSVTEEQGRREGNETRAKLKQIQFNLGDQETLEM